MMKIDRFSGLHVVFVRKVASTVRWGDAMVESREDLRSLLMTVVG